MLRVTPSHLKTSLSGSSTTPVSSAMIEFGILKVEAGSLRLARADLVAGDDQVVVDLVADEGAGRAEREEPPGQIIAKLAALVGDIGKAARGQEAGGGKQAERMATIDHGGIRTG